MRPSLLSATLPTITSPTHTNPIHRSPTTTAAVSIRPTNMARTRTAITRRSRGLYPRRHGVSSACAHCSIIEQITYCAWRRGPRGAWASQTTTADLRLGGRARVRGILPDTGALHNPLGSFRRYSAAVAAVSAFFSPCCLARTATKTAVNRSSRRGAIVAMLVA